MNATDKALESIGRYDPDIHPLYYPIMRKSKNGAYVKASSAARAINALRREIEELKRSHPSVYVNGGSDGK
jgi:hypothetical protein